MSIEIIIVLLSLVAMLTALIMDKMRPGMILFSVVVIFLCTVLSGRSASIGSPPVQWEHSDRAVVIQQEAGGPPQSV